MNHLFAAGLLLGALSARLDAQVLDISMQPVEDAGNLADTNGLGDVAEPFRLGTFEITNLQYVVFLNAVAADDIHGLYAPIMTSSDRGGIVQNGSPGAFTYATKPGFADKPANGFNWTDGARFCNWLHNGQPVGAQGPGTTEDGAYDLSVSSAEIVRSPGAHWFLPTHDEWYKAAYYDPSDPLADAGGTPDYWFYPTRSDSQPTQASADGMGDVTNPGSNVANHSQGADWNDENGNVTTVGGCGATSPWGLFDVGGNINELTETLGNPIPANPPAQPDPLPTRTIRGGDFANSGFLMASPDGLSADLNMLAEGANIGMRVASLELWEDLGFALAGTSGEPHLQGLGTLEGDTLLRLNVTGAKANSFAFLFLGLSQSNLPFLGGVLVPSFDFLSPILFTSSQGTIDLPIPVASGSGPGVPIVMQFWINDSGAPFGYAATNGILKLTP
jgi:sulfatase modifying factor 1